jgi:ferritin-like metal-binding protein YciE
MIVPDSYQTGPCGVSPVRPKTPRRGLEHRAGFPVQIPQPPIKEDIMAFFSKDIETLDQLYLHMLQDIYYAEQQIEKALPKMIDKASNAELKKGFEDHLEETHGHVERLEEVFRHIGEDPKGVTCPAIDGIIKEANEVAGDIADKNVLDAALAAAAQAVEHYEMTRYGTLIAWSNQMGRSECAQILQQTLQEEKAADEKLTQMAESRLNPAA